tara:strand:+ start:350 stop:1159 length:810 start_codon:yes stop_codon:yes gene_type:complete
MTYYTQIAITTIIFSVFTLAILPVFADGNEFIAIFSSGCADCPNIYELIRYDTSNQDVSGSFIIVNNATIREPPQHPEHMNWYKRFVTNSTVIFVEPTSHNYYGLIKSNIKKITIIPFFEYDRSGVIVNGTTTHTEKRVITHNCNKASISATWSNGTSSWQFLLDDTINYMAHNCDPEFTMVNGTIYTDWNITETKNNPSTYLHNRMVTLSEYCHDKYPCPDYVWDHWGNDVLTWYNQGKITHLIFDNFLSWMYNNELIEVIPYHEIRS